MSDSGDSAGRYYLYIVDAKGNRVNGSVTVTYTAANYSETKKIGFFKVAGRPDMEAFWRSLLSRSAISEGEAQYLEKIFSKAAGLIKKNSCAEK